jgi:hypothetical protein
VTSVVLEGDISTVPGTILMYLREHTEVCVFMLVNKQQYFKYVNTDDSHDPMLYKVLSHSIVPQELE